MSKKILLIDDEPGIANAMKRHIEDAGFHVDIVDNGQEGLEEIASGKYDLILLDVLMPEFDGIAVLEEINSNKEKYGTPKIIVVTNNSSSDTREKVTSFDIVKGFFDKGSMTAAQIIDKIKSLIH